MKIEQVKLALTKVVENNSPAKFLGALVLGTALVAVAATGMTAGQVQASENQVSTQIELGEECLNPVTGEPIGLLPNQVSQRSQGVLASPLSIESDSSWGLAEENFHPVTGEKNVATRTEMQISSINLGEEYFHPVTGEKNAVARSEMHVSNVNLGEEYFHPVTGENNAVARTEMQISSTTLGEEYFHPVTGEKNAEARTEMQISAVNLGEEYFHPVTGKVQ